MTVFFGLLLLMCIGALVIGLIKPGIVLPARWRPTRAKAVVFWVAALVLVVILTPKGPPPSPAEEQANAAAKQAALTRADLDAKQEMASKIASAISAEALMSAYEANEVQADGMCKGKLVVVSGRIGTIGKDILGSPYVALKTHNPIATVQVMFDRKDEEPLAELIAGQQVVLQGKCSGKMMNVILREGKILR